MESDVSVMQAETKNTVVYCVPLERNYTDQTVILYKDIIACSSAHVVIQWDAMEDEAFQTISMDKKTKVLKTNRHDQMSSSSSAAAAVVAVFLPSLLSVSILFILVSIRKNEEREGFLLPVLFTVRRFAT